LQPSFQTKEVRGHTVPILLVWLASRWFWSQTKDAMRKEGGNVSDIPQLVQILWWLVRHAAHICEQRLKRLELFLKRDALKSFSPPKQKPSSLSILSDEEIDTFAMRDGL
jgi:hypothetical protein